MSDTPNTLTARALSDAIRAKCALTGGDIAFLRWVAMDWHGGQLTALYSFGSSGKLTCDHRVDQRDYLREVDLCLTPRSLDGADNPSEALACLTTLRAYFVENAQVYDD